MLTFQKSLLKLTQQILILILFARKKTQSTNVISHICTVQLTNQTKPMKSIAIHQGSILESINKVLELRIVKINERSSTYSRTIYLEFELFCPAFPHFFLRIVFSYFIVKPSSCLVHRHIVRWNQNFEWSASQIFAFCFQIKFHRKTH